MEKFVPFEKLSKRKKRELNARKRRSWNGLDPVTRRPPDPKAYNRRKAPRWQEEPPERFFVGADGARYAAAP